MACGLYSPHVPLPHETYKNAEILIPGQDSNRELYVRESSVLPTWPPQSASPVIAVSFNLLRKFECIFKVVIFRKMNFVCSNSQLHETFSTVQCLLADLFQVHNLRVQVRVLSSRVRVRVQVLITSTRVLVLVTKTPGLKCPCFVTQNVNYTF